MTNTQPKTFMFLQDSAGWTYNDQLDEGESTIENLRLVLETAQQRHWVITLTNQWVRRWYDREVERIGRGFIGITNGEIHMAHETMLAFWQDASVNVSEGTGHESLLIAHASCLLAVGRRYPAVFETQYWKPPRGHLAMSSSRSEHIFEHVFERHALGKSSLLHDRRYCEYHNTSAGLLHYVSHIDARACLTPPSILHHLLSIPFGCWLATNGAQWERTTCIRGLAGQLSRRSFVLGILIMAGNHRSACTIMTLIDEARKSNGIMEAVDTPSAGSALIQSNQEQLSEIAADDCNALETDSEHDVNESRGYLLWLASHYDDTDVLDGLFQLGARIDSHLSLASNAIHQAVEYDKMEFVWRFLQLCCPDAADGLHDQERLVRIQTHVENLSLVSPSSEGSSVVHRECEVIQECRRTMFSYGVYTGLINELSPLTLAYIHERKRALMFLLQSYPLWEDLLGTSGSTLVEAVWCNKLETVRLLLQLGSTSNERYNDNEHSEPSACNYEREDLYAATLASVHQGNCDILDVLLEAGAAPGIPAQASSTDRDRIRLQRVDVRLSPLHLALVRFRSRDVDVSKCIVQSLKSHGAILYSQVEEKLYEWVDMGHLHDEDCMWLRQLFPAYVGGPLDIMSSQIDEPDVLPPQFVWDGSDSEGDNASDDFSEGSSAGDSMSSFMIEEAHGE
jgi:hypothetical protein